MLEFLTHLFDTTGFPARWNCGQWTDGHGWLHIISDLLIFGAYAAIPISITSYVVLKKQEVAFPRLYWLFAGFILSCGFTHLIEASIFWHPWYRFSAAVKVLTAVLSWATVIALLKILPVAMQLPGTAKLNRQLREEVKERQESEKALQESSARLALAMEQSGLGDWSWEAEDGAIVLSRRGAEILGLNGAGPGRWEDLVSLMDTSHRDRAARAARQAAQDRSVFDEEFLLPRPGGNNAWVAVKGRCIYAEDGKLIRMVGTLADVTERKKSEGERENLLVMESKARQEAQEANRMKDEFLAVLSHELRAPLNAILGWAGILKDKTSSPEELQTGLDVIERNTIAQTRLVEDLLDMSRITSGKFRLDLQSVELTTVVKNAEEGIQPAATAKDIRVTCVIDPLAGPVRGDPARLQQAVANLLSNAVKFTPPGGKIDVAVERINSHVEISVSDTGMGIAPEFLPHVFDRFRQADATLTRRHGGLGLGLAIVKTLIEMHGGTVQAKSPGVGKGASFRIALPLPVAAYGADPLRVHPASDRADKPADLEKPDLSGSTILAVDDETDNLEMIRRLLENQGAQVIAVASASPALDKLSAGSFDLLISDIGMPEIDGFEFIKTLRSAADGPNRNIPAIALTAFARPDDRRRAMVAGFDTFLSKPVDPDELLAVIHRHLDRASSRTT